ncbi:protein-glutamine gamma-glutamyltransferase [Domibacillus epiphyticus]|uniref:Protein-glutamine gamma-glutamyltransferase n=1 Tax=Domibacillus epiphyticus TaxID=1714355 RepID=A0A1V2ABI7_9BACI|nr:protein-glutamine gamma-glutamyltransferase [Domibacillus epiphyticus]OMP68327.1 protein-glutamine gamma-glutamyltransferase [Domibacillus epiphyticus]
MIQISGTSFQQSDMWPSGSIESMIIQQMNEDTVVYSYQSIGELSFELQLRKNIILSARAMNQSNVRFETFANSRSNLQYWHLTRTGGFLLRNGVKPSDAIRDIYLNSSQYAFECSTAKVIIYYHAVLNLIGESLFNQLFQNIYLYNWHADPDLGIKSHYTGHFLPGDVVYFNNPDFDPQTPQWRGENAVVLGDGTYFGHGLGILRADQMIHALNQMRMPGANQSAYLTDIVARPSFKHLKKLSTSQPGYSIYKNHPILVNHIESSTPFNRYVFYF